ncbi:unnamed protein product [Lactuca virosa]|uniref:Uncharacterized protein n=1 Tax=Lactuca virosa TaxID=75947 RepID=A0AAU9LGU9_9ASTR|nr:unnamed protein product [Lactuca virosa]
MAASLPPFFSFSTELNKREGRETGDGRSFKKRAGHGGDFDHNWGWLLPLVVVTRWVLVVVVGDEGDDWQLCCFVSFPFRRARREGMRKGSEKYERMCSGGAMVFL